MIRVFSVANGTLSARLQSAWVSLAIVVGLHVADEAVHDFLSVYNPVAAGLRARYDSSFPPSFSFGVWLVGLIAVVLLCIALTPLLEPRRKWMMVVAIVWSVIHIANGLAHLVSSFAIGRMMPGVWTAPLLLLVAPWLLVESRLALFRNRRAPVTIAVVTLLLLSHPSPAKAQQRLPYAPVGLFFGSIEDGARIFTPMGDFDSSRQH